jgi:hypothetical protein
VVRVTFNPDSSSAWTLVALDVAHSKVETVLMPDVPHLISSDVPQIRVQLSTTRRRPQSPRHDRGWPPPPAGRSAAARRLLSYRGRSACLLIWWRGVEIHRLLQTCS